MALVNPLGKSDKQYVDDIGKATLIIREKSSIALGGARAAREQRGLPKNERTDGAEMVDAQGNRAIVYPDGTYKEI